MAAIGTAAQALGGTVSEQDAREAVTTLLRYLGEDPARDGLAETPRRVVKALSEMTQGYQQNAGELLSTVFDEPHDQMIVVRGVRFVSLCEHHLLPFVGSATVGYVPRQRVVGLSKLARVVLCFAKRLQIQERMTDQIARAVMEHTGALGAGVIVKAHHSCMGCRGALQPDSEMVTSSMLGVMRDMASARAELVALSAE